MVNSKMWIYEVDEFLADLRAHLLGKDISLKGFAPHELSEGEQIKWLANRIAFQFAARHPREEHSALQRTTRWIYASLKFLHENCEESDLTLTGLSRLLDLSKEMRLLVFMNAEPDEVFADIRNDGSAPSPLKNTEEVLTALISDRAYAQRKNELSELKRCMAEFSGKRNSS